MFASSLWFITFCRVSLFKCLLGSSAVLRREFASPGLDNLDLWCLPRRYRVHQHRWYRVANVGRVASLCWSSPVPRASRSSLSAPQQGALVETASGVKWTLRAKAFFKRQKEHCLCYRKCHLVTSRSILIQKILLMNEFKKYLLSFFK